MKFTTEQHAPDGERRLGFGPYEFDSVALVLWRGGRVVPLQKLPARVLDVLLRRRGGVVLRSELYDSFWAGSRVGADDRVNTAIAAIRAALGDSARSPSFIETVPRRGYRFAAPVRYVEAGLTERPTGRLMPLAWWKIAAVVVVALSISQAGATAPQVAPSPSVIPHGGVASEVVQRAKVLARSGKLSDLRESVSLLERSLSLDPGFADAHATYAALGSRLAFLQSEPALMSRASRAAHTAMRLAPEGTPHSAEQGMIALYGERRFQDAIVSLEDALERSPDASLTKLALADAYRRSGDWAASDAVYQGILRTAPDHLNAISELALNHRRNREWALADDLYRRGMILNPRRYELVIGRAVVILRSGGTARQALEILERSEELRSIRPLYSIFFAGELTRIVGPLTNWESADLNNVTPFSYPEFLLNRAWLLDRTGRRDEAEDLYRRLVEELEPHLELSGAWLGVPNRQGWLGRAYAELGMEDAARVQVDQLLRSYPGDGDAVVSTSVRWQAALVLIELGDLERALDVIEELLERPSPLTKAALRLDPIYDPLRNHPRFARLVGQRPPQARTSSDPD